MGEDGGLDVRALAESQGLLPLLCAASIRSISVKLGTSRNTVRRYLRGERLAGKYQMTSPRPQSVRDALRDSSLSKISRREYPPHTRRSTARISCLQRDEREHSFFENPNGVSRYTARICASFGVGVGVGVGILSWTLARPDGERARPWCHPSSEQIAFRDSRIATALHAHQNSNEKSHAVPRASAVRQFKSMSRLDPRPIPLAATMQWLQRLSDS